MTTTTEPTATVTTSEAMGRYWHRLGPGVRIKVLWSDGDEIAGVLLVEPGASVEPHAHAGGSHHLYVLEGRCWVGDRLLVEGGYAHVPEGASQALRGDRPLGCRLLYVAHDGALLP